MDREGDFRARYFDRVEEAWSRYVELLFPLASVCVFPDIVHSFSFLLLLSRMLKFHISFHAYMAWVSVRCRGNQGKAMHTELSRFWDRTGGSDFLSSTNVLYHMLAISYKFKLSTNPTFPGQGLSSPANETHSMVLVKNAGFVEVTPLCPTEEILSRRHEGTNPARVGEGTSEIIGSSQIRRKVNCLTFLQSS
jgi:hypothetical protein